MDDITRERKVISVLADGPVDGMNLPELRAKCSDLERHHFSSAVWWLLNYANVLDYDWDSGHYTLRPTHTKYLALLDKAEIRRKAA